MSAYLLVSKWVALQPYIALCGNKYGNLALQVGGVSDETVIYGREFCGTSTQEWLLWQGPEAILQQITDPSSRQRGRYKITKSQLSKANFKEKEKSVTGPRWAPDTKTDWPTDCWSQINFNFNFNFNNCSNMSAVSLCFAWPCFISRPFIYLFTYSQFIYFGSLLKRLRIFFSTYRLSILTFMSVKEVLCEFLQMLVCSNCYAWKSTEGIFEAGASFTQTSNVYKRASRWNMRPVKANDIM
jgi:hypothetical protein